MKELSDLKFPADVRYAADHEWAKIVNGVARVGISDFAQDQLGDITFVELPQVGDTFGKGDEFGTLESTKAVSELIAPLSGEVVAVNEALEDNPALVNGEPYEGGWIIEVRPEDPAEMNDLMDRDAYVEMLKNQS
jgi:glycine cleavage system H protein